MTIREFVKNLYTNAQERPSHMTLSEAETDLANFAADGWDLPEGMTAEDYMSAWNALVDENEPDRPKATDMIRFRVTPAERVRIQALADRIAGGNMSRLIKTLIDEKEGTMMKKLYIAEYQNEAAYDLRVCTTFDRDEAVAEAGTAWRYMTDRERKGQVLTVLAIDVPDSCATIQDAEDWLDRTDGWSGGGEVVLELGR